MGDRLIRYVPIYGLIVVVSVLHYTTGVHNHQLHDIYRRLYYLPIILAAFAGGIRGGLVAAVVVGLLYYPHAFGHLTHDPGRSLEKILEMVLYFVVAATTGYLVNRGGKIQEKLRETADDLFETLREKERMEQELLRAARLAAVGKLSAGLAHEIRNPLTSIKGSAELLQDDFPGGHPKRELLETLIGEADRLNNVLTRFLSFARPLPISAREYAAPEVIEEVVALLDARKGAEETPIRLHESEPVPRLKGDPEQIRQVLLNILLNAVQASPHGAGIDIHVSRLENPKRVEILVEDRGPGFDTKALDQLFTPFFTTKAGGTGLGLAISHRIIESHGGKIAASNRPGGGARVSIVLPV